MMTSDPTTLATDGFIADEAAGVVAVVRARYAAHFTHLASLNRLLTMAQYRIEAHRESAQHLTCIVLFVRALAHCQATILLLERGMRPSGRAMLRCSLEALFNLGACASDHRIALAFIDSHHVDRRRLGRNLAQVEALEARALIEPDLEETMRAINAEIEAVGASERGVRTMARAAGLEDVYLVAYALLSGAVHSRAGDLDRHFRETQDSGRLELLAEPEIDNLNEEIELLAAVMAGIAGPLDKVFALGISSECDRHYAAIQALSKATG